MGKSREEPLIEVDFSCQDCGHKFTCAPENAERDDSRPWHPWFYTHPCPRCLELAEQDPRQRGLLKAWAHATGPRTVEGKAASAANLDGHPTAEETRITRMNALKHGGYANTLNYFPAKPGHYATCEVCHYFGDVCIKDPDPHHENPKACLKRAELFMRHQIAFDTGDVGMLTGMRAETQAGLQAIVDEMILQIAQDGGPRIMEMKWYHDKEGEFHLARYLDEDSGEWVQVYEAKAHPLLKPLIDFVSKNSLTLADMGMTPKVQQENELLAGHLQGERDQKSDALEFRNNQTELLEQLKSQIENSQKNVERDPVLIEYNQGAGDG